MAYYSVIIPIHNEVEVLLELHRRLTETLRGLGEAYEIIFVDDGSTDQSYSVLRDLHKRDPNVVVIKFSRNFGHHTALTAGIDHATGDIVVTMDGDLQHQPEDIPALINELHQGFDVVYGIRTKKRGSAIKLAGSRMIVAIMNRITEPGFTLRSSVFLAMNRKVVDGLGQCRETSRFLPGLISWLGFKQGSIEVTHGDRTAGLSKYNFRRSFSLAVSTITAFSYVPLTLAIWFGLILSLLGAAGALSIMVRSLWWDAPIQGYPSLIVVVAFVGGVQLIILGILGEYIGRSHAQLQNRPLYVVDGLLSRRSNESGPSRTSSFEAAPLNPGNPEN